MAPSAARLLLCGILAACGLLVCLLSFAGHAQQDRIIDPDASAVNEQTDRVLAVQAALERSVGALSVERAAPFDDPDDALAS